MRKDKDDSKEKENISTLKMTDKIISNLSKQKINRHVKEENEPAFEEILNEFQLKYGTDVVAKSCLQILKLVKNEF